MLSQNAMPLLHHPDGIVAEPNPAAQRVIDILSVGKKPQHMEIAAVRRSYNVSRRQFLGAMEPVENIMHICPAGPGIPRLTVIRPQGCRTGDTLPTLVYLHGGGWTVGGLATYEPLCRQLANACNMIVVWVEYRLAPEHPFPAAYDDALAAWRWVISNSGELGADAGRIAIGGDSAGGNLAAAACVALRDSGEVLPRCQLLLYPCLDLTASMPSHRRLANGYLLTADLYAWYRENYIGDADPRDLRLSPLFVTDARGLPQTVLLYCGFDPLRDEAGAFAKKLALGGVGVETLYFPDMIHGFLPMGGAIPAANFAIDRIANMLSGLNR